MTGRARRAAGRAVAAGGSVAAAVRAHKMSWPIAHAAFVAHADARLAAPGLVRMLGIDETRRGLPTWVQDPQTGKWSVTERFETNFVDLAGHGGLLGQTAGRTRQAVVDWLEVRGQAWCDQVQVVAIDPCAAYRAAVHQALPNAIIVADHFHLVRLANQAVTDVRQRVVRETHGRRRRAGPPGHIPEVQRLATTIDAWWPEVLTFLTTDITNAGTEGANHLIKDAARVAFGFHNLDNQRRRVLNHPRSGDWCEATGEWSCACTEEVSERAA